MRYFTEFSYNGKNCHGWQLQLKVIAVQGALQGALATILRGETDVIGAGRTNSDVYALQMFAHPDTERELSDDLIQKLNALLPYDIIVYSIRAVKPDAHTRFDALRHAYQYHISIERSPLRYNYSMPFTLPLNIDVMSEAIQILFNYANFQYLSRTHTGIKTFNCKIYEAHWAVIGGELVFTTTVDRFLRNMVRAIVGTLIDVGLQRPSFTGFEDIIVNKSRSKVEASIPVCGLFSTQVIYPEEILLQKSN